MLGGHSDRLDVAHVANESVVRSRALIRVYSEWSLTLAKPA